MNLEAAFDTLERYYLTIYSYNEASNYEGFNVDTQLTKQKLEKIVDNRFIDTEDIEFLKELLEYEDLGETVEDAIAYIIENS